ncbi:MAG TPA: anti-phage dCTP deaminase [Kofleriaceae bacterium]|nr:anti-phage dCTP deaminase [Kofleriaceae bacterium]
MHPETRRLLKDPWPELVFGLTAAVGADVDGLVDLLDKLLKQYRYKSRALRLSALLSKVDPIWLGVTLDTSSEFQRVLTHMNAGDALRGKTESGEALAVWSIGDINSERVEGSAGKEPLKADEPLKGMAHILRTIKHPDEVRLLREVYKSGFYLVALHASEEARFGRLTSLHGMTTDEARQLISRDQGDAEPEHGQQTRDTFQMADVFILQDSKMQAQLDRFLRLVFGDPLVTPTRDEHAMFMAYAAALRSADLSRQVGAVIRRDGVGIVAIGANDVPAPGGGLYWPDEQRHDFRDYRYPRTAEGEVGHDSNERHKREIADEVAEKVRRDVSSSFGAIVDACITGWKQKDFDARTQEVLAAEAATLSKLAESELTRLANQFRRSVMDTRLLDITEFGRAVHAEMDALLACTRCGTSTRGAALLCTTFPCHNCAKHIVAAGIRRVVYIEPYAKSQAFDLHRDSIVLDEKCTNSFDPHEESFGSEHAGTEDPRLVIFQPFIGIGPRRFFDLFSMKLSAGDPLVRKDKTTGDVTRWTKIAAEVRIPLSPISYLDREDLLIVELLNKWRNDEGQAEHQG